MRHPQKVRRRSHAAANRESEGCDFDNEADIAAGHDDQILVQRRCVALHVVGQILADDGEFDPWISLEWADREMGVERVEPGGRGVESAELILTPRVQEQEAQIEQATVPG